MTIGKRIKQCREELNLTQEELAGMLGFKSRSSINKIELGIYMIPEIKIIEFCKILRVSPNYLLGWDQQREKDSEPKSDLKTRVSIAGTSIEYMQDTVIVQGNKVCIYGTLMEESND